MYGQKSKYKQAHMLHCSIAMQCIVPCSREHSSSFCRSKTRLIFRFIPCLFLNWGYTGSMYKYTRERQRLAWSCAAHFVSKRQWHPTTRIYSTTTWSSCIHNLLLVAAPLPLFHITSSCSSKSHYNYKWMMRKQTSQMNCVISWSYWHLFCHFQLRHVCNPLRLIRRWNSLK